MTPDDIKAALASHRDRQFADLLVVVIGLAAHTHPEELRHALASVFDLTAVTERGNEAHRLAMLAYREAARLAAETRELATQIHRDIEAIESRLEALDLAIS